MKSLGSGELHGRGETACFLLRRRHARFGKFEHGRSGLIGTEDSALGCLNGDIAQALDRARSEIGSRGHLHDRGFELAGGIETLNQRGPDPGDAEQGADVRQSREPAGEALGALLHVLRERIELVREGGGVEAHADLQRAKRCRALRKGAVTSSE
ncbi:hypothetical protein OJ996_25965 [Luteolibacter sp. GHJ8]|uniref:Uncharacterized protein n=1 Tax=Luteolibacter rhizosphaerae TaxID=2989719 RepID=A0ABT3GB36_9BACT|nr:hypothetical protein [Luteolibacter rhizosphaerae]MCW1917062.1 hypothetical protein [Luteolibacter rhizosphaerae]